MAGYGRSRVLTVAFDRRGLAFQLTLERGEVVGHLRFRLAPDDERHQHLADAVTGEVDGNRQASPSSSDRFDGDVDDRSDWSVDPTHAPRFGGIHADDFGCRWPLGETDPASGEASI